MYYDELISKSKNKTKTTRNIVTKLVGNNKYKIVLNNSKLMTP